MRIDSGETECEQRIRDRAATDKLLGLLRLHHSENITIEEIEAPAEAITIKTLPPIPNKALAFAHDLTPHDGFVKVEMIQKAVLNFYPEISMADLKSCRRSAPVVRARQVAMYLSKVLTDRSFPDIGRRFGGRDHSTAMHAFNKMKVLVGSDVELAAQVAAVTHIFQEGMA